MKFNLKNRPSHEWMFKNLDKIEKVDQWFEGFEKELRELRNSVRNLYLYEVPDLIKEILGETT